MQHNFQQEIVVEYTSDSYRERTVPLPSTPYSQRSASYPPGTEGYVGLPNEASFDQMYEGSATTSVVTTVPMIPAQHGLPYDSLGTSPMSHPFSVQAQCADSEHLYLLAPYQANNMISPGTPSVQEQLMYAQQPHGSLSQGPAGLDASPAQEFSASSLVRKRSRRKERILCSHEGCGREMSRDSLGRHVKEIHRGMKRKKSRAG